ncbi:MAG: sigma-70 family RNA polymerase sigma factor [Caldilineae bacterium]|nr:MAG: sigma-70 family RNA polymerase sigma factor [Caldilineae bacterium]
MSRKESRPTVLSDVKLLTQLQAGDDASFEVLFLRHYDRVYGVLFRILGNRADAEDVAQQVFLKLYRAPRRIRLLGDGTNVAGWLYRVAVNSAYNAVRSRNRRRIWTQRLARLLPFDAPPDPAEVAMRQDAQARVRQTLATMKPRDAKLLLLRHSGLSYRELAAALGVAPGSVGSLLTRAERAFARQYRLLFGEEETEGEA